MIFNLYAGGKGLKSLVNHINKLGYRSKKEICLQLQQLGTFYITHCILGKFVIIKCRIGVKKKEGKE